MLDLAFLTRLNGTNLHLLMTFHIRKTLIAFAEKLEGMATFPRAEGGTTRSVYFAQQHQLEVRRLTGERWQDKNIGSWCCCWKVQIAVRHKVNCCDVVCCFWTSWIIGMSLRQLVNCCYCLDTTNGTIKCMKSIEYIVYRVCVSNPNTIGKRYRCMC